MPQKVKHDLGHFYKKKFHFLKLIPEECFIGRKKDSITVIRSRGTFD